MLRFLIFLVLQLLEELLKLGRESDKLGAGARVVLMHRAISRSQLNTTEGTLLHDQLVDAFDLCLLNLLPFLQLLIDVDDFVHDILAEGLLLLQQLCNLIVSLGQFLVGLL